MRHVGELTYHSLFARFHHLFWNYDFLWWISLALLPLPTVICKVFFFFMYLQSKNFPTGFPSLSSSPIISQAMWYIFRNTFTMQFKNQPNKTPTWTHSPYNVLDKISSQLFMPLFFLWPHTSWFSFIVDSLDSNQINEAYQSSSAYLN